MKIRMSVKCFFYPVWQEDVIGEWHSIRIIITNTDITLEVDLVVGLEEDWVEAMGAGLVEVMVVAKEVDYY